MRRWLIIFFSILFLGHDCLEAKTAGCRFSIDPLAEGSISITPYGYCGNNPLVRIDPDGRSFDRYQSDYGSVRWFRSSRERLFFHSEWWTRLGAEYSLELGDGRFLNFYQNVPVSLTDSRASALLGILNNDGFKGFLLSKDSPLDEEYRHDIVRRSIHHAQNEFLDHPLVRGTFDVLTFVGMGGVESLFSLSSSLCGFSGKHFGRTAIKTTLRAAKGSTKLLPQFANSTIDDAVALTMKQKKLHIFANKLHPKPWLNQLSTQMSGSQNVIKAALQNANGRILPNAQGIFNTPVNVGGVNFTIRDYINQGTPIINSIFIP